MQLFDVPDIANLFLQCFSYQEIDPLLDKRLAGQMTLLQIHGLSEYHAMRGSAHVFSKCNSLVLRFADEDEPQQIHLSKAQFPVLTSLSVVSTKPRNVFCDLKVHHLTLQNARLAQTQTEMASLEQSLSSLDYTDDGYGLRRWSFSNLETVRLQLARFDTVLPLSSVLKELSITNVACPLPALSLPTLPHLQTLSVANVKEVCLKGHACELEHVTFSKNVQRWIMEDVPSLPSLLFLQCSSSLKFNHKVVNCTLFPNLHCFHMLLDLPLQGSHIVELPSIPQVVCKFFPSKCNVRLTSAAISSLQIHNPPKRLEMDSMSHLTQVSLTCDAGTVYQEHDVLQGSFDETEHHVVLHHTPLLSFIDCSPDFESITISPETSLVTTALNIQKKQSSRRLQTLWNKLQKKAVTVLEEYKTLRVRIEKEWKGGDEEEMGEQKFWSGLIAEHGPGIQEMAQSVEESLSDCTGTLLQRVGNLRAFIQFLQRGTVCYQKDFDFWMAEFQKE